MFDLSGRLMIAYGLIALIVLAVAGMVLWRRHNTPRRRRLRDRVRTTERYRRRQEQAAATDDEPAHT